MAGVLVVWIACLTACGRINFGSVSGADGALGGGDGGGNDGGGGDAALACSPTWELCDGFETGTFDPVWTVAAGVTLDPTMGHRGAGSVHAHSNALGVGVGGYFTLDETATLALNDPTFYVRGWFRIGSLPAGSNGMELISADQTSGPGFGNDVFVKSGLFSLYSQFASASQYSTTGPPLDTWFCVVWQVVRTTSSTGSLVLSGDTMPTTTLPNIATDGTPPIGDIGIGVGFSGNNVSSAQPAIDLWIDDVIVDKSPVTCAD